MGVPEKKDSVKKFSEYYLKAYGIESGNDLSANDCLDDLKTDE